MVSFALSANSEPAKQTKWVAVFVCRPIRAFEPLLILEIRGVSGWSDAMGQQFAVENFNSTKLRLRILGIAGKCST
jgi:hypothetical protein